MTREEAARYFKRHIDLYCVTGICREAEEMAIEALEQEPQTFEWCTDCREYDQEKHCCHRWSKVIRYSVEDMNQSCEDAISRKEALEALEQEEPLVWCDGADEIAAYDQWSSDVDTIKNMPSVQPKPIECEDAISRQAAIDALTKTSGIRGDALKALYDLPHVQPKPKTGQWIKENILTCKC